MRVTPRRIVGLLGVAAAALVALAMTSYACTNMATLNLSSPSAKPGGRITITGSSFSIVCICGPSLPPTPVKIRWNGIKGDVLAEAMPDRSGAIAAAFTVPDVKPGYYVIVGQQHDDSWNLDVAGTPARATFEVLGPNGQSVVGNSQVGGADAATDDATSSGLIALSIGLGALGLALFAGGSVAVVRQVATRRRAAPAVVKQD